MYACRPIDFLKDERLVLPYAIAFGSVALTVFSLLLNSTDEKLFSDYSSDVKPWIKRKYFDSFLRQATINFLRRMAFSKIGSTMPRIFK